MIPSSPSSVGFVHKGTGPFFEYACNCYVCIVYRFRERSPEWSPGMSDVCILSGSGISGLTLESPFVSPVLFLCLVM